MYLIRNKKNKEVLFMDPFFKDKDIDPEVLLPEYNADAMETGWSDDTQLPQHFRLDKNGRIQELSLEEQLKEGLVTLTPGQKIENNQIVLKTLEERQRAGLIAIDEPFQYINSEKNSIENRSLKEVINKKLIRSVKEYDRVIEKINEAIAAEMDEKYAPSDEIKLMKNYLYWLDETYYVETAGDQYLKEIRSAEAALTDNEQQQAQAQSDTDKQTGELRTINDQIRHAESADPSEKFTKTQLNALRKQKEKLENDLSLAREQKSTLLQDNKTLEQRKRLAEAALEEIRKRARAEREKARNEFLKMKSFTDKVKEKYRSYKEQVEKMRSGL